jgi:hypothetical protein
MLSQIEREERKFVELIRSPLLAMRAHIRRMEGAIQHLESAQEVFGAAPKSVYKTKTKKKKAKRSAKTSSKTESVPIGQYAISLIKTVPGMTAEALTVEINKMTLEKFRVGILRSILVRMAKSAKPAVYQDGQGRWFLTQNASTAQETPASNA